MPPDSTLLVTIKLSGVTRLIRDFSGSITPRLSGYGCEMHGSCSSMTITINNYDQPLETLAEILPELEFQIANTETRTIIAIEAPL
ncbi:MAG: hypothetical protein Aurels2KO_04810 [Aureliella sp.]